MALLNKRDKIMVAGHTGLVGSAILKTLQKKGYENFVLCSIEEINLEDNASTKAFFEKHRPDVVFLAAAKVGGIHANNTYRAEFIFRNLQIQNNVIWNAHLHDVHRLVFLGSSCIYPRMAPQPMPETCLLTSPLEYTNRPYALAKIAGLELVNGLRLQYGRDYFSAMPTNQYGPGDNYHPEDSHVLPALIRRFYEAKQKGDKEVVIWGTGKPLREFLFSLDCADAIVHLAENLSKEQLDNSEIGQQGWSHVNIGFGEDISIGELAKIVAEVVGFAGELRFDSTKPDGTPKKLLDSSYLQSLGWKPQTPLPEGIQQAFSWFQQHHGKG